MQRQELYRDENGNFVSGRVNAHVVDAGEVVIAWRKQTARIPAQFAVGTGRHETNMAVNERDLENDARDTITDGLFQLDSSTTPTEMTKAGFPEADPFDLDDACTVFAAIMERNFQKLLDVSGLDEATAIEKGILGYLAWSHNTGLGHKDGKTNALESIQRDGLDWSAWCARNQGYEWGVKMSAYGSDCVTGGSDWRPEFDSQQPDPEGDSPNSNPYDVSPVVSASTRSKLRLLAALVIVLLVLSRLVGRGRIVPKVLGG